MTWVKGLTSIFVGLLGLGVVAGIVFGDLMGIDVVGGIVKFSEQFRQCRIYWFTSSNHFNSFIYERVD